MRHEFPQNSLTGPQARHPTTPERDANAGPERLRRAPPRLVAVLAVVAAVRPEVRREREWAARLGVAAHQLQGPAQAEERVVVRRRALDDLAELFGGLAVATRAEQRPAERLADGGLVGLEVTRPREGHGGGVEVAVLEEPGAVLEELVCAGGLTAVHLNQ